MRSALFFLLACNIRPHAEIIRIDIGPDGNGCSHDISSADIPYDKNMVYWSADKEIVSAWIACCEKAGGLFVGSEVIQYEHRAQGAMLGTNQERTSFSLSASPLCSFE